jgi:hypothetical protein
LPESFKIEIIFLEDQPVDGRQNSWLAVDWAFLGGEACFLIRKHDHFTPVREIRRDIRALEHITAPKGGIILSNTTHLLVRTG